MIVKWVGEPGGYYHVKTDEGEWFWVSPEVRPDKGLIDLKYKLHVEGNFKETFDKHIANSEPHGSYEKSRLAAMFSSQELGYANVPIAQHLLEMIETGSEETDPVAILRERMTTTDDKSFIIQFHNQYLSVYLRGHDIHVIYEKSGWTHWNNLMRLHSKRQIDRSSRGPEEFWPLFWPSKVKNPLALGARFVVDVIIPMVEARQVWTRG